MTSYVHFTDTLFNVTDCTIDKGQKCVKGDQDPLTIQGPWTFMKEPARLRHYVMETVQSKNKVKSGTLRYDAKLKKYYNHSIQVSENVKQFYNDLVTHGLLHDVSGNKITAPWPWSKSRCSASRPGMEVLSDADGHNQMVVESKTCGKGNNGSTTPRPASPQTAAGRRRKTRIRKTRARKTRRR